jgi:hypothetical protein
MDPVVVDVNLKDQTVTVKVPITKWLLLALAIILGVLSITVMVMGFGKEGHPAIAYIFGVTGVIYLLLVVAILVGLFVPMPLMTVIAYYLTGGMFFFNLSVMITQIIMLIAGSSTEKKEGSTTKTTNNVGVEDLIVCVVIQLLLIPIGYLLHHYASKHQAQTIAYSPTQIASCSCCRTKSKQDNPPPSKPEV